MHLHLFAFCDFQWNKRLFFQSYILSLKIYSVKISTCLVPINQNHVTSRQYAFIFLDGATRLGLLMFVESLSNTPESYKCRIKVHVK